MIYKTALKVAHTLDAKGYIKTEEIEIIAYGLFSVLSKLIYGIIILFIGILFNNIIESLSFYIAFLFIKKYAGGIHASTESRCFFASFASIVCSLSCISFGIKFEFLGKIIISLSLALSIFIYVFAPIASEEKPLDKIELEKYAKISRIRTIVLIVLMIAISYIRMQNVGVAIGTAIILESVLVILGKIRQHQLTATR